MNEKSNYSPLALEHHDSIQMIDVIVNSQPIDTVGTYAIPLTNNINYPQSVEQRVNPRDQNNSSLHSTIQVQSRRERPPNRWSDSICDWTNNIFPSCWCVCCCCYGIYLLAQSKQSNKLSIIFPLNL